MAWDKRRRILLHMKLTAMPGHASKHCSAGHVEPGMRIDDDQLDPAQSTGDEALEKGAPIGFMFTPGHRHPQDLTGTGGGHPDRDQHGCVAHLPGVPHRTFS